MMLVSGTRFHRQLGPTSWLVAVSVVACTGEVSHRSLTVVRDSAGVQIVENAGPLWRQGEEWRLAAEPVMDIGRGDTESDQLYRVRGATRLSDGRVVVANGGTSELRFYDRLGVLRVSAGGEGGGPGEFDDLELIGKGMGDSILVYDRMRARMTVFDPEGNYVRSVTLDPFAEYTVPAILAPIGQFMDGSLLVPVSLARSAPAGVVTMRWWSIFARYSMEGTLIDSIAAFPTSEHFPQLTGNFVSNWSLTFGRVGTARVFRNQLLFGDGTSFEVQTLDLGGRLTRLARSARPRIAVTETDKRRIWEDEISGHGEIYRAEINRMYAEMPFPTEMPAFARFEIDPSGGFWVELYRGPGDKRPRWVVFDRDGRELGVTVMPERFEVFEIGNDYVLGKWEDADDVEHVRMYELVKPTG